ncbi:MBG domain-containing protein [Fructilactobacillus vespulae]|uniref:mucin-binding protein n=1 Tax=Fructilactobacillus vespulae TaxID=1249630 RepID=UPI0039B6413B
MLYNKSIVDKTNDKKVLRKVKKNWVIVSLATFMFAGAFFSISDSKVSANDSNGVTEQANSGAVTNGQANDGAKAEQPNSGAVTNGQTNGEAKAEQANSGAVTNGQTNGEAKAEQVNSGAVTNGQANDGAKAEQSNSGTTTNSQSNSAGNDATGQANNGNEKPATANLKTVDPKNAEARDDFSIAVNNQTKSYDENGNNPSTYLVTVSDNVKTPNDWYFTGTANTYQVDSSNIDTKASNNQYNVGTYETSLNSKAIEALKKQNSDLNITSDQITKGSLTITKSKNIGNLTIVSSSKEWDNNTETNPKEFEVKLANNSQMNLPSSFNRVADGTYKIAADSEDLNVQINSQAVGRYEISLSQVGLDKLKNSNPNFEIDQNVINNGIFQIKSNQILDIGTTSMPKNSSIPDYITLTINRGGYQHLDDWKEIYNNKEQSSVIYNVPKSYFNFGSLDPSQTGSYEIKLSQASINKFNENNSTLSPITNENVGTGHLIVYTGAVPQNSFSPSNFFVYVDNMKSKGDLSNSNSTNNVSNPTSLTLNALMLNGAGNTINDFNEFYVVPSGFLVGSTNELGKVVPASDPVATLQKQLTDSLQQLNVKYSNLQVQQLPDFNGRQSFRISYGSVTTLNGNTDPLSKAFKLLIITDPNSSIKNSSIGTDPDDISNSVVYVTDDRQLTNGNYSIGYSNDFQNNDTNAYVNVINVANAFGVKNAFVLNQTYSNYIYPYQFVSPQVKDTYKFVGPDGNSINAEIAKQGNAGDLYNTSEFIPQKIEKNGITYRIKYGTDLGFRTIPVVSNVLNSTGVAAGNTYTIQYVQVVDEKSADNKIKLQSQTKVYDAKVPTSYQVILPTELVAPTEWAKQSDGSYAINSNSGDLDLSQISTAGNVGTYEFTLSMQGLNKLAALNSNYAFNEGLVENANLTITKAPVTITGPKLLKVYDGQPYSGNVTAIITGQPANGSALNYTVQSISSDINPGQYQIAITAGENPNYTVSTQPGSLTILAKNEVAKSVHQTIKYVDADNNAIATPATETVNFTRTATINETTGQITYSDWQGDKAGFSAKTSPVITGYYLKDNQQATIVAKAVTETSGDDNETVVYGKMGSLTPVDPNGNPIAGHDTQYPNDPKNPSQPGEPTIPTIPGKTPFDPTTNQPLTPGSHYPIDPSKPGDNTQIVYVNSKQNINVSYVDIDDNQTLAVVKLTGKPGDKAEYTTASDIEAWKNKCYVLVNDGYPAAGTNFGIDDKDQNYVVTLKHQTKEVTPNNPGQPGEPIDPTNPEGPKYPAGTDLNSLSKTVHQTINYVDEKGNELAAKVTDAVTFTRNATIDEATGRVNYTDWKGDKAGFSAKTAPVITGYYLKDNQQATIAAKAVTASSSDDNETVVYGKMGSLTPVDPNGNPISGHDTQYPNDPKNPMKPGNPIIPAIPGMTPIDKNGNSLIPGTAYPIDANKPGEDVKITYVSNQKDGDKNTSNGNQTKQTTLPQTGQTDNSLISIIGMGLVTLFGLLGFKKKEDK